MTYVLYDVTTDKGTQITVKSATEAKELVQKEGGTYKQRLEYHQTYSEAHCRRFYRHPAGAGMR